MDQPIKITVSEVQKKCTIQGETQRYWEKIRLIMKNYSFDLIHLYSIDQLTYNELYTKIMNKYLHIYKLEAYYLLYQMVNDLEFWIYWSTFYNSSMGWVLMKHFGEPNCKVIDPQVPRKVTDFSKTVQIFESMQAQHIEMLKGYYVLYRIAKLNSVTNPIKYTNEIYEKFKIKLIDVKATIFNFSDLFTNNKKMTLYYLTENTTLMVFHISNDPIVPIISSGSYPITDIFHIKSYPRTDPIKYSSKYDPLLFLVHQFIKPHKPHTVHAKLLLAYIEAQLSNNYKCKTEGIKCPFKHCNRLIFNHIIHSRDPTYPMHLE